jgi:hypothetical protein
LVHPAQSMDRNRGTGIRCVDDGGEDGGTTAREGADGGTTARATAREGADGGTTARATAREGGDGQITRCCEDAGLCIDGVIAHAGGSVQERG